MAEAVAALLLLLPGLLVVRAPWTVVPALSLAFWSLSAAWTPGGLSRARLLAAALLAFLLLLGLRLLPKHEVPPPPGWTPPAVSPPKPRPGRRPPALRSGPSLLVAAASLLLVGPVGLWHNAPGARLAFQTTAARLLVWHDGRPLSAEPLLPLAPFGAHAPALASLAADLSLLSGLDAAPAVLAVVVSSAALALIGLFALCATRLHPWAAAVTALAVMAAVPWPDWLEWFGPGEALLALAFLLPAAALMIGHSSRSSAVAAGLLAAAGALAHPILALVAFVASGAALRRRGGGHRPALGRAALAAAAGVAFAAPGLLPLIRALSLGELARLLSPPPARALLGVAVAAVTLVLAPAVVARAGRVRRNPRRASLALAAGLATLVLVARVHAWIGAGQLPPAALSALAEGAARTTPLDALCAPEGLRDWVPALAARAPGEPGPWIPLVYSDEWRARRVVPCAAAIGEAGDIVSPEDGKRSIRPGVLIDGRGGATQPTR